jgi:cytochrome c556
MLKKGLAALAAVVMLTAGVAAANVIEQRQKLMEGVGDATKPVGGMLKGSAKFDLAKVQATLKTYEAAAKKMPELFPENSKTGNKTTAAPKIWEDMNGFKAAFDKFGKDSAAALETIKDEASFKATFPGVLKNCGSCHEQYRVNQG